MSEQQTRSRREAVDVYRYDSYSAILKRVATPPTNPANRQRWQHDFNRPDADMMKGESNLGADCEQALAGKPVTIQRVTEWLRGGWPQGVTKIKEALGEIKMPTLTDIRRRAVWGDTGDELSVDRLYSGQLDRCWRDSKRGVVRRPPPLHIFCDISVNCHGDALFWRGAVQCAFAEAAIAVGHRVCLEQVINIEGLTRSGSGFLSVTRIKDYDAPLNPAALAAIGASVASLRLTDFGHCVQVPETIIGYGAPHPISVPRLRSRGVVDEQAHTLLIPQTLVTKQQALDWIAKVCADLERRVTSGEWHEPSPELGGYVAPQLPD